MVQSQINLICIHTEKQLPEMSHKCIPCMFFSFLELQCMFEKDILDTYANSASESRGKF